MLSKLVFTGNELSVKCPELVEEWDFEKNYPLTPDDVNYGSSEKFNWKCKTCGCEWIASANGRSSHKSGCPECAKILRGQSQKKTYAKRNNFTEKCPDIAKDWDYEKNKKSPKDYSVSSNEIVFWKCSICGYEWKTSINHRTTKKATGCPNCALRKRANLFSLNAAKRNNFAEKHPELAKEWNTEKNIGLSFEEFSAKSNIKVWWKCTICNYEWQANFNHRSRGQGCPNCSTTGTSFSEQAIFYYVSKIFTDAISRYISNGFEFDVFIPSIQTAIEYDGVFYHNSKKSLDKDNKKDLYCKSNNITLIRFRDSKLKDTDFATRITCADNQGKDFEEAIYKMFSLLHVNKCPLINISKDKAIIMGKYRLAEQEKSLANLFPELIEEWNFEKNGNIKPENTYYAADIPIWWKCAKCGYEWQTTPYHRTVRKSGCSACKGFVAISGFNDLKTLNPTLAKQWNYERNGSLTPEMVRPGSRKKVWWTCDNGHEWEAVIHTRNKGVGCPKCYHESRKKKK